MANWQKIKHAWVTGSDDVTFAALATKYKVKRGTICYRAAKERWSLDREAHRSQVERAARQKTLQEQIQDMVEGTVEDFTIYEQLIALGLQDVTGRYGDSKDGRTADSKDAKRPIKIYAPTLLTAIRDRRKLREWVHGEEPVPDETHEVAFKLVGVDMSKILALRDKK